MLVNKIICKMCKYIGNSLNSRTFAAKLAKKCWNYATVRQLVTTKCHEWNSGGRRRILAAHCPALAIFGMDFNVAVANVSLENTFYATFLSSA